MRPAIVLPGDWREWDAAKLDAVLAHERSHIRRRDPAVQVLSAIHRALLWHSPLSWFLHRRIVRVAEEASDDAAVAATRDRASYAEVLLEFMQRGVRTRELAGRTDGAVRPAGRAHPSHSGWDGALARSHAMEHGGDSGDRARRSHTWLRRRIRRTCHKHRLRQLRRRQPRGAKRRALLSIRRLRLSPCRTPPNRKPRP